jgi:hypothetical protein
MTTEVRAVGTESFEEVYPLLRGFPTTAMSKEDWRRMLFTHRWSDNPQRGYALYADGKPVGFLGTIFSQRNLAGRTEQVCSLSSWIVLPEHRGSSLMLVTPILRLKGCTIVNPTPSPAAYDIFCQLGFKRLESERVVLAPVPGVAEAARSLAGSFHISRSALERELGTVERALYDDLSSCAVARHVVLRRGSKRCYVVATPVPRRGLRFAEVQYIGDPAFFWEHRILAHAALFACMGAVALRVDRRFVPDGAARFAVRRPSRRLFRPSRSEIVPEMIDGLYSELMELRW